MFNCESCKTTQPPKTKPHRVIIQKRLKAYLNHEHNNVKGEGWEIVKEANICDDCYEESPFVSHHEQS